MRKNWSRGPHTSPDSVWLAPVRVSLTSRQPWPRLMWSNWYLDMPSRDCQLNEMLPPPEDVTWKPATCGGAGGGVGSGVGVEVAIGVDVATGGVVVATGGVDVATGGVVVATGGVLVATGVDVATGVLVATGGVLVATGGVLVATGGVLVATGVGVGVAHDVSLVAPVRLAGLCAIRSMSRSPAFQGWAHTPHV